MCSFLTQIVYGIISFVILAFSLTSMFTKGWSSLDLDLRNIGGNIVHGASPFSCPNDPNNLFCEGWFDNLETAEKIVVVCLIIGTIFEAIAFVYNILTVCACCCKEYLLHPLTFLSLVVTILYAVAVAVFAINHQDFIKNLQWTGGDLTPSTVGFSFYFLCGALVLALINTVVAAVASFFADHCC